MKELSFAQRLADNEKKVRDRALKKLKKYLSIKSNAGPAISQDEALRLWKGLFYCMYMADKPLIQEHVAEDISSLIHSINNEDDRKTFTTAGFMTFSREWNGIDVFRIEKYMMFVRRFLRHIFIYLKSCEWSMKEVTAYTNIIEGTVVCPNDNVNKTSLGLKSHVCDVILEELAKVGGENLHHSVVMAVIQPYLKVLALTKINAYSKFVCEEIIHHLIRQSLCAEENTAEDGDQESQVGDTVNEEMLEESEVPTELDPRAGKVDTFIPQLKVDLNLLADALQKIGAVSRIQTKNREVIYRLVCELRDAAQGTNPLALKSDNINNVEVPDSEVEMALERLEKFEEDLKSGSVPKPEDTDDDSGTFKSVIKQNRKKKFGLRKKRKLKSKGLSKAARRGLNKRQKQLIEKRVKAVEHVVRQVSVPRKSLQSLTHNEESNKVCGFEVSPVSQKVKSTTAINTSVQRFMVTMGSDVGKKRKYVENTKKGNKRKKSFDVLVSDIKSSEESKTSCAKKNDNKINCTIIEKQNEKNVVEKCLNKTVINGDKIIAQTKDNKNTLDNTLENGKDKIEKQNRKPLDKLKATTSQETKTEVIKDSVVPQENTARNISNKGLNQKKHISRSPKMKSPWDEPLQNGEYEIFVKSRKQITKSKKKKISPIKKRLTAIKPKQRTISINLKRNKEHEFSDYVRTIRASPSIPFKADQAPKAPVLKPSPSPILVKGHLLRKKIHNGISSTASPQFYPKNKRQTAADFF